MVNLGQTIKKLRLEKKLTQKGLGDLLGVTQGAVGHWETGKKRVPIDVAELIANIFNMPLSQMVKIAEDESGKLAEAA